MANKSDWKLAIMNTSNGTVSLINIYTSIYFSFSCALVKQREKERERESIFLYTEKKCCPYFWGTFSVKVHPNHIENFTFMFSCLPKPTHKKRERERQRILHTKSCICAVCWMRTPWIEQNHMVEVEGIAFTVFER